MFEVVLYNKDSDLYETVYEAKEYDLSVAIEVAKAFSNLVTDDRISIPGGDPFDWVEVVQKDDYDILYWSSY